MKVLLLGGTAEARQVAALLVSEPGVEVVSSLAGRTLEARLPAGAVRQGGFGGVTGLTDWLRSESVDAVVDATHPFAATMTANAVAATASLDLPLLVLRRPGWSEQQGDRWVWVDSAAEAAAVLRSLGARVFLTIGRQGLGEFADAGVWMLARCVDPPTPLPAWCEVILDRGPYELAGELDLLRRHRIDVLVTKDSGGEMTAAKLEAARQLAVPVVVIRRPPMPEGVATVASAHQVIGWLQGDR